MARRKYGTHTETDIQQFRTRVFGAATLIQEDPEFKDPDTLEYLEADLEWALKYVRRIAVGATKLEGK